MKFNDPAAHLDPRDKFTGMKGFRQVVVGSGGKPLDDLRFVGVARKQDEVRVKTWEVATYAPA